MIPTKRSLSYNGETFLHEQKKLKTMEGWKMHLDQAPLGLCELFGGDNATQLPQPQWQQQESQQTSNNLVSQNVGGINKPNTNNNRTSSNRENSRNGTTSTTHQEDATLFPKPDGRRNGSSNNNNNKNNDGNFPYTFRLERRKGGALARHANEERILLFRSDRPGAIAKIIFSSKPAKIVRHPTRSTNKKKSSGIAASSAFDSATKNNVQKPSSSSSSFAKDYNNNKKEGPITINTSFVLESKKCLVDKHEETIKKHHKNVNGNNNNNSNNKNNSNDEGNYNEEELNQMAQATIHVLDVKEQYRGRDLGGLLFSEATSALRDKYDHHHVSFSQGHSHEDEEEDEGDDCADGFSNSVRCQLDAEEDVRRHNKLVSFYESLGCRIKPRATVRYLNNNDGETYRKIPMQIALRCPGLEKYHHHHNSQRRLSSTSLVDKQHLCFLPVRILESKGTRVSVLPHSSSSSLVVVHPTRRLDHWLMVDDGTGYVQFQTTQGHRMRAQPDGCVSVLSPDEEDIDMDDDDDNDDDNTAQVASDNYNQKLSSSSKNNTNEWCKFKLCRVPDKDYDSDSSSFSQSDAETPPPTTTPSPHAAARKELWTFLTNHGTYLTTDPISHSLASSKIPSFWQANKSNLTLVCTRDTPPRRMHYRQKWSTQTVNYVRFMREKYLTFGTRLGVMEIRKALDDIATSIPCRPFRVLDEGCPSLRSLCYCTAEEARRCGHPDWVQLVALLHDMGRVVSWLDARASASATATTSTTKTSSADDGHDWTIASRSRIVGCAAPDRATFAEFRHLNSDESDARYNTLQGMYRPNVGLDNTWLNWTGPEYMYHMLKHNEVTIPEEGMAMLRYFSLGDWHEHDEYSILTNEDDADVQYFVSDFDRMRRRAWKKCREKTAELSDEECEDLWEGYYARIAAKYNCGGDLRW